MVVAVSKHDQIDFFTARRVVANGFVVFSFVDLHKQRQSPRLACLLLRPLAFARWHLALARTRVLVHFQIPDHVGFDVEQIDSLDATDADGLSVGNVLQPLMQTLEMVQRNLQWVHQLDFSEELGASAKFMQRAGWNLEELEMRVWFTRRQ